MGMRSEKFWDRVSRMSPSSTELGSTAFKTVETARNYLSRESDVFDVGCGPGDLTIAIAQSVKSIHAIDTSSGVIEVANTKVSQQEVGNIHFQKSDLPALAPDKVGFTAVTAFNVLHYIEYIPEFARQIEKRLGPGGLFLSSTACMGERKSFLAGVTLMLRKLRIMRWRALLQIVGFCGSNCSRRL